MEKQRGIAMRYFAGAKIADAYDANGVGKAVCYGTDPETVVEGTAATYADFAGVIKSVATGQTTAATGDAVGVNNDKVVPVKVTGAVDYADLLTLDDAGTFKKLTPSGTITATEVMQIVGRVVSKGTTGAGVVDALIWVRK